MPASMLRTVLIVLVLLVALPGTVGGGSTTAGDNALPTETTHAVDDVAILTLDGGERTALTHTSIDVSTALAVQHDAAAGRLEAYDLAAAFDGAENEQARREVLLQAATAIETRSAAIRDHENALRQQYLNGTIGTSTFIGRLVRNDAKTLALQSRLDRIGDFAEQVPRLSLRSRLRFLEAGLVGAHGPIGNRAIATMRGDATPFQLYVSVTDQGAILSMIDDGQYVRTAFRSDRRDLETADGYTLDQAVRRTAELYPVAYNSTSSLRTGISSRGAGLYRIDIELPERTITAYLDSDTREVFYEVQQLRLDLLSPGEAVVNIENGTQLAVNRTFPGGPMRIVTVDNETGVPVSAAVEVDGTSLETGEDGVAWTLGPADPSRVIAIRPAGTTTVRVSPRRPGMINATS